MFKTSTKKPVKNILFETFVFKMFETKRRVFNLLNSMPPQVSKNL